MIKDVSAKYGGSCLESQHWEAEGRRPQVGGQSELQSKTLSENKEILHVFVYFPSSTKCLHMCSFCRFVMGHFFFLCK
jgi:hypothetical protein